jgi:hypothetical protein
VSPFASIRACSRPHTNRNHRSLRTRLIRRGSGHSTSEGWFVVVNIRGDPLRARVSITSPLVQHSPNGRRVCIRIVTFEACSGFTRVTAGRIAQPPKVTFVTRLQPGQLPDQAARQLPDLSTIIRVEPSSTDDSRLQGAPPRTDLSTCNNMWSEDYLLDHLIARGQAERAGP